MSIPHLKGGQLFGLVGRIVSSTKSRTTKIFDYMGLIINYLRKRRVGGLYRDYTGIMI